MTAKHLLAALTALRQATTAADRKTEGSFAVVFNAFLDIAEDPGLFDASKPAENELVQSALEAPVRKVLRDESMSLQHLRMFRCADAGFLHGGFHAGSMLGTFFFFEKEQQGLLALNGGGPMTQFARLTLAELPPGSMPAPGPKGTQ